MNLLILLSYLTVVYSTEYCLNKQDPLLAGQHYDIGTVCLSLENEIIWFREWYYMDSCTYGC